MEHEIDLDRASLTEYLAGEVSAETEATIGEWIGGDPSRAQHLAQLRRTWRLAHEQIAHERRQAYPGLTETVERAVLARIEASRVKPPSRSSATRAAVVGRRMFWRVGLGALVVVVALTGIFVTHASRPVATVETYQTKSGERATIRLADGSRVTLAPATVIHVRRDTVVLRGEAFFTIQPRPNRPFVVQTENALVRVLGTAFAVRQYASDRASQVVVEDGRVTLRSLQRRAESDSQTVLTAGMLGRVVDSSILVTSNVPVREYTGWTQGQLVFEKMPLRDVIEELARAYGTEIQIADSSLARKSLTIAVSVDHDALPQILGLIGLVTDAHYTRVREAFVLAPGRGAALTPQATPQVAPQILRFPQPEKQYGK